MTMTDTPKRRYTRLTPATWSVIRAHWELGEVTLPELADLYGVAERTLQSADDRERRSDAAARLQRAHGAKERRHHQRRGAPLLPREAGKRRGNRAQGRGKG